MSLALFQILLILLIASIVAVAQCAAAHSEQTVMIQAGRTQGSGFIAGHSDNYDRRAIVTVRHVVGAVGNRCTVTVFRKDGVRVQFVGYVAGSDAATDSALVLIRGTNIESVPSARLYGGEIWSDFRVKAEGFASGSYTERIANPSDVVTDRNGRMHMVWNNASFGGMSGGAVYVLDTQKEDPYWLCSISQSDFRSASRGPYRTWYRRWIPTCSTPGSTFNFRNDGSIRVLPRRRIEGPLQRPVPGDVADASPARPQRPPADSATPAPSLQPDEGDPGDPYPEKSNAELMAMIQQLMKQDAQSTTPATPPQAILEQVAPTTTPAPRIQLSTPGSPPAQLVEQNRVYEIPVLLRIRQQDKLVIEALLPDSK
jgi:hypothetical protein